MPPRTKQNGYPLVAVLFGTTVRRPPIARLAANAQQQRPPQVLKCTDFRSNSWLLAERDEHVAQMHAKLAHQGHG